MAARDHSSSGKKKTTTLFLFLSLLCFVSLFLFFSAYKTSFKHHQTLKQEEEDSLAVSNANPSLLCDYNDGSWIYDPTFRFTQYDNTCKEIFKGWNCISSNKSNARDLTKWRWKPHHCDLPTFDSLHFLHRFRNTNIGFIGDSLNRNMFVSLVCTLKRATNQVKKWRPAGADRGYTFLPYNLTVAYHRTNLLARYGRWSANANGGVLESLGYKEGYRVDVDVPDGTWAEAPKFHDIIIINTGHWWWAPSKFDPINSPMLFFEKGLPVIPPIQPYLGLDMVLKHMVTSIILGDKNFWAGVKYSINCVAPLVRVLRLVDGDDRPSIGYIYEAMDQAKEKIATNLGEVKSRYEKVWEIIDDRWNKQLHRHLLAAAYYLNPRFHFDDKFKADEEIMDGYYSTIERMVPSRVERRRIDAQLDKFRRSEGSFGRESAVDGRTTKQPAYWWESFGSHCPELQRVAIRILSLVSSATGCERNWSTFEQIMYVEKSMRADSIRFFRTQSPRHFEGGDWDQGGSCQRVQPLLLEQVENFFSLESNGTNVETRLVNQHLNKALKGSSFRILDITHMSEFRADAHPSAAGGKKHDDCMHWCLPGITDTWNDLLIAYLNNI